jgi:hypothetical protein
MRRLLVLALLVYLALDFGDPSMPGALNFDPDQSVEAVSTQPREGAPVSIIAALSSPVLVTTTTQVLRQDTPKNRVAPADRRKLTRLQRPRALLSQTPTSPEAH